MHSPTDVEKFYYLKMLIKLHSPTNVENFYYLKIKFTDVFLLILKKLFEDGNLFQ